MKMVKLCYRYSCGHNKFIRGSEGRLLIHSDECIRKRCVCEKCHDHEEARKASRKRMGWFVGSDRAEYAWDKKRNEADKKKRIELEMEAEIEVKRDIAIKMEVERDIEIKIERGRDVAIKIESGNEITRKEKKERERKKAEKEMLILA